MRRHLGSAWYAAAHELRAQLWTFSAPLAVVGLAVLVLLYTNDTDVLSQMGAADLPRNSAFSVYVFASTMLFPFMFFLAHMACAPILRDGRFRMAEVMHASPCGSRWYLFGKWVGTLLVGLVVGASAPLAFALCPLLVQLGMVPARAMGPTPWLHLAHLYAVYVVPLVVALGSLYFGLAVLTGRAAAGYTASFVAAVTWMLAYGVLFEGDVDRTLGEWLDPIGYTSVIAQSKSWTAEEKLRSFVALTPDLLLGRAGYLLLGLSVVAAALWRPRTERLVGRSTGLQNPGRTRKAPARAGAEPTNAPAFLVPATRASGLDMLRLVLGAGLAQFRELVRSRVFQGVFFVDVLIGAAYTWVHVLHGAAGAKLPWTGLAWPTAFAQTFVPTAFFLGWTSGQLARRERDHGFEPLMAVLPASGAVLVLPRLIALVLATLVFALAPTLSVLLLGLATEPSTVAPSFLVLLSLTLAWPSYLELSLLTFALYGLIAGRWAGHFAAFAAMLVCVLNAELRLFDHDLLLYAMGGSFSPSELTGWGDRWQTPLLLAGWFVPLALLLVSLAIALWPRGADVSWRARLGRVGRELEPRHALVPLLLALVAGLSGGAIRHGLEKAGYRSPDRERREAARYEQQYRPLAGAPALSLAGAEVEVLLEPSAQRAQVRVTMELQNRGTTPVARIDLDLPRVLIDAKISASGLQAEEGRDRSLGRVSMRVDEPIPVGASQRLELSGVVQVGAIQHANGPRPIATKGAWLTADDLFPYVGYDFGRELTVAHVRQSLGLPAYRPPPGDGLALGRSATAADVRLTVRAENGCRPIVPRGSASGATVLRGAVDFAFTCGAYARKGAIVETSTGAIPVTVHYSPVREQAAVRVLTAATEALRRLAERYGAYGEEALHIVQVPRGQMPSRLVADTMFLPEEVAFEHAASDPRHDFVLFEVTRALAEHWAMRRGPTLAPGDWVLRKGLTTAMALAIVGEVRGDTVLARHADRLSDHLMESVASAEDPIEAPLAARAGEHVSAEYAGLALHAVREEIGGARFDAAVASWTGSEQPDGRALAEALRRAGREQALAPLAQVLVWDTRLKSAVVKASGDGATVSALLEQQAFRLDGRDWRAEAAQETDLAVELLDMEGRSIATERLPTREGAATLQMQLPTRPARLAADPRRRFVERNPKDNERVIRAN